MNMHRNEMTTSDSKRHLEIDVIAQIILDLLKSADMRPGDAIDLSVIEYELGLRGINEKEFKRGFAQLINHGVIDYIGSRLCLTRDGFSGLNQ